MADEPSKDGQFSALANLIVTRRDELGMSGRALAKFAGISHNYMHRLSTGNYNRVPGPRIIDGLVRALGVSRESLIRAAMTDIGIIETPLSDDDGRKALYVSLHGLSPADAERVRAIVELLRRAADNDDDGHTERSSA
jgi:transcriptional regulator with XRE-family HTH domain